MNFTDAIKSGFRQYVTFSGRASRSEFWFWVLFVFLGAILFGVMDAVLFGASTSPNDHGGLLSIVFNLATFLPYISVAVRRLHDINKSGWWMWLSAICVPFFIIPPLAVLLFIGTAILLIVWNCTKGTAGDNRFGPDPLAEPRIG